MHEIQAISSTECVVLISDLIKFQFFLDGDVHSENQLHQLGPIV
jgi:hypothetical protein